MKVCVGSDNIYVPVLKIGTTLRFHTQNSIYDIEKIEEPNVFNLNGGSYFPPNTKVKLMGTTFGGSMIRARQLASSGVVELWYIEKDKKVCTSWCDKVEYLHEY